METQSTTLTRLCLLCIYRYQDLCSMSQELPDYALICSYKRLTAIIVLSGNIYLNGGSTNMGLPENSSRVVMRLNLSTCGISITQPLLEPTSRPAVASSQNMIAVCGGSSNGSPTSVCQIYSIMEGKYVCYLIVIGGF